MSGGSFDYLCFKDVSDLIHMESTIQEMADELAGLGYAKDAAQATQEVLENIRVFTNRLETKVAMLSDVWKAMEWWRSCDSSEDNLKEALEKYRTNV